MRCFVFLGFFIVLPVFAFAKGYTITPKIDMVGKRLHVAGKTNLPDGSHVSITVAGKSVAFMSQGDAVVGNGSFDGGAYGPESGVRDGGYTVEVGALKPGTPANEWHTAKDMIETTVKVAVKGGRIGKFDATSVSAAKELTLRFAKKLSVMEKQGRKMEGVRFSPVLDDMVACSRMMRKLQPIADQYHQEAEGLPLMYAKMLFGAASTELKMCVSCSDDAVEHCKRAKEYIAEGVKSVKSEH